MPPEIPNRICKEICKKFRVKKVSFKGRYGVGQAHCQICDIWIDYKGCHMRDGSPAKEKSMGWFCNCCNYRVRQNPRKKIYKERLRRTQEQHAGSEQESDQLSNQTSQNTSDVDSMVLKALEIIKDSPKGIYYAELKKSIEISDNDMNELVLKIIQKGISRKEIKYGQRVLDILFEFKNDSQEKINMDIQNTDAEQIQPGQTFTNQELQTQFKVGNSGGIRISTKIEAILLISSSSSKYANYVNKIGPNNEFISYTGQGQNDQEIKGNNKSLTLAKENGYTILYFEKPEPDKYIYRFPVECISHSFDKQENIYGEMREVILFKLKILQDC